MARCEGNEIEVLERVFLPHSLGSLYTMICEFIGYTKYGDEGKVMGLAPYGKETYCEEIAKMVTPKNGGFQLDLNYFKPLGSNQGMQVLAGRHGEARPAFFGPDGETVWRAAQAADAKLRSATWIWLLPCSIASRKSSFTC